MGKLNFIGWAQKNSPAILTGFGIAGILITSGLSIRGTVKATELVEKARHPEPGLACELTKKDILKTTWKCYIPAMGSAILTAVCFLAAHRVQHKRLAAIATAYSISEAKLHDYQKKVVEAVGDKKDQAIKDAIAKEKVDQIQYDESKIFYTGQGDTLCLDVISGRYFKHDIEKIRKSVNELNRRMRDEMYISVNEFYYAIGLPPIARYIGDDLGWNIDNGYIDVKLRSQLTENDLPCLVLDYSIGPRFDYRNLH